MDLIQTIYDSRGFKTMVFDNAMPESVANKWLDQRRSVKFYKTKQHQIPMSFRVHAVNAKERESLFSLSDWLEPYLKEYHPDLSESNSFSRSFINCYQKNDHIRVHADLNASDFGDEHLYAVVLLFLTPDEYITDPTDCGFVVNNSMTTRDNIIDNKFNRLIIMDARSLHEPCVPSDDVQRLTLYAGYTISELNKSFTRVARENKLIERGLVPGTNYQFELNDFIFVD